ncbi:MAG: glycosyltransferase family 39 protein, partial [Anaerolineae bacterium]
MRWKCHLFTCFLIVLLLIALGLRLYRLDHQSFWIDEITTAERASQVVPEILKALPPDQSPLYYVFMHFWLALAGRSDFALRFPSALFSVLAMALLYRLMSLLFGRGVALVTAFIAVINPFQEWYAQEARNYTLLLCFILASLLFFVLALRHGKPQFWLGYCLTTLCGIYTHYFAALVMILEGLFLISFWLWGRYRQRWKGWLLSQAAIGLLYLPWLPMALRLLHFRLLSEQIPLSLLPKRMLIIYNLSYVVPAYNMWDYVRTHEVPPLLWGFVLLAGTGLLALLWPGRHVKPEARWLTICYLIVPAAFICFTVFTNRDFKDRYMIPILPVYYLLLALGMWALWRAWKPLGVAGALFVAGMGLFGLNSYFFDPVVSRPGHKGAAIYVQTFSQQDDAILPADCMGSRSPFSYYYEGSAPVYTSWHGQSIVPCKDEQGLSQEELARLLSRHKRWWVLSRKLDDFEFQLVSRYYLAECEDFSTVLVCLYSTPEEEAVKATPRRPPASARSDGEISLAAYRLYPNPIPSGQIANLSLFWKVNE